jgi:hypothetical protein
MSLKQAFNALAELFIALSGFFEVGGAFFAGELQDLLEDFVLEWMAGGSWAA